MATQKALQKTLFTNFMDFDPGTAPKTQVLGSPRDFEFKRIPEPSDCPDNRGKHAYERFHEKARKVDEKAWRKFFELLRITDATLMEHLIIIGEMWNKLTIYEQMDYEDAIGLRG